MANLLVTLKNNPGCAKDILTLVDRETFRPVILGSLVKILKPVYSWHGSLKDEFGDKREMPLEVD